MSVGENQSSAHFESVKLVVAVIFNLLPSILWSIIKFFIPKRQKDVSGQLALITGGSEGIGRAIAVQLAQKGCRIAIANRNLEKGQTTAEEISERFKVEAKAFRCDVGNREDVKKLKEEVKKSMGIVDILVNNAGLMPLEHSLLEGDDEPYQYCMDVNLTSWIWTARSFLPDMIKQKRGHIVGISSLSVKCPIQNMVTYVASKHGNSGFMDALRQEMCFYGFDDFIKLSTVYAGFVKTNDEMFSHVKENFLQPLLLFSDVDKTVDAAVSGILKDQLIVHASYLESLFATVVASFPQNVQKFILQRMLKSDVCDDFVRNRQKKWKI